MSPANGLFRPDDPRQAYKEWLNQLRGSLVVVSCRCSELDPWFRTTLRLDVQSRVGLWPTEQRLGNGGLSLYPLPTTIATRMRDWHTPGFQREQLARAKETLGALGSVVFRARNLLVVTHTPMCEGITSQFNAREARDPASRARLTHLVREGAGRAVAAWATSIGCTDLSVWTMSLHAPDGKVASACGSPIDLNDAEREQALAPLDMLTLVSAGV